MEIFINLWPKTTILGKFSIKIEILSIKNPPTDKSLVEICHICLGIATAALCTF